MSPYKFIKTNKHKYSSKINFTGKLEELHSITKLFISGKQQKAILNFSINSLIVTEQYN